MHIWRPGYINWYSDGLRTGGTGFDSQQIQEILLYSVSSRSALRPTQPPVQWKTQALSSGVKRPGREADHLPPSSLEVKKDGAISPFPYVFMVF
jgi:hypothetical protein